MKTSSLIVALLASTLTGALAQVAGTTANQTALPAPTEYAIVATDNNSRVWERTEYEQAADGTVIAKQHRYTELATGLNYQDPQTGRWQPSQEEIDILPNGGAATHGAHQVYFPGDIAQGVIRMVTPDGLQLQSRPVGLFFNDDSNTVMIAILTNSVGQLVSSNQVVYPNAFEGASASVRYTYSKSGFEQDVIVQAQLPDPAALGVDPARTRLGVLTVFFDTNNPVATAGPIDPVDGLSDATLAFGKTEMSQGRAFSIGDTDPSSPGATPASWLNRITNATQRSTVSGTHTYKRWFRLDGRNYLMEEVPYPRVAPQLQQLPPATGRLNSGRTNLYAANSFLKAIPGRLLASGTPAKMPAMRLSRVDWNKTPALVLDYVTVNSGGNYLFQGDTTYYVTGPCYFGNVTIEGGTVIKYENMNSLYPISIGSAGDTATAFISVSGTLTSQTSSYHPAIFTAADDNTVGAAISGSTGNPSGNFYANPAIYSSTSGANIKLSNVRIRYAERGVWVGDYGNITLSDSQVSNCQLLAILGWGDGYGSPMTLTCNNCLYNGPYYGVLVHDCGYGGDSYNLTNCTFTSLYYPIYAQSQSTYYPNTINAANCIFANCNMYMEGYYSLLGGYNGFYNSSYYGSYGSGSTFGSHPTTSSSNPFQTSGGGNFYLASGSTFRGKGTTAGVSSSLLADLKTKTTQPPNVSYIGQTISADNFTTQVPRDSESPGPDLGYHYDPLDYVFQNSYVNSSMTFPSGTAVGWQGPGQSLRFQGSYTIAFNGTVALPCYFACCDTVQESSPSGAGTGISGAGQWPELYATFTRFSALGFTSTSTTTTIFDTWTLSVSLYNCEFWNGQIGNGATGGLDLYCHNCLFDRTAVNENSPSGGYLSLQNCTLYGGSLTVVNTYNNQSAYAYDSAFDGTVVTIYYPHSGTTFGGANNAYRSGATPLLNDVNDTFVSGGFNWQSGVLGNFYLPANSPLIDHGDSPATSQGLGLSGNGAFTTQTTGMPDYNTVDIGYHYYDDIFNQMCPNTSWDFCLDWYNSSPDQYGALTYTILTKPAHGTWASANNYGCSAEFIYTPNSGYIGPDSFVYQISDGVLASGPLVADIVVGDPNSTANSQTAMTGVGQPITLTLSGSDGCNDPLTFAVVSGPANGHLGTITPINATQASVTYTPNTSPNFEGVDQFQFTVNSGFGSSSPATVTIFVVAGPTNLTAQCASNGPGVLLKWNLDAIVQEMVDADGLTIAGFEIYRRTAPGTFTTNDIIYIGTDGTQTNYLDMTVVPGMTNYYKVDFLNDEYNPPAYELVTYRSPYSNEATNIACLPPSVGTNGVDVAFIIDNTGSMGASITAIQSAIDNTLDYIADASGNNYRLALVTPDLDNDGWDGNEHDMVDVRISFSQTNRVIFESAVNALSADGGNNTPESTDQCLNTVVNALLAVGRTNDDGCTPASPLLQTNNFSPAFRTNAVKLVILITDAPPSGFCDSYPPTTSQAHEYALEASTNHIHINAIQISNDLDATPIMQDYSTTSCGWYEQLDYSSSSGDVETAILNMLYLPDACH